MIKEYENHNHFWIDENTFFDYDPQLGFLKDLAFIHPMNWWAPIDWHVPGIFILTGGRQVGKTTSTKLLIKDTLLKKRFPKNHIFYLPCDQIDDHHHLGRILRLFFQKIPKEEPFLLIVDEVTYVREWDRAIKALADEGLFRRGFCVITGSDSIILKEAISRFPGRRGEAGKTDYHIAPLDFREYIGLVEPSLQKADPSQAEALFSHLDQYFQCGGHLKAINDLHAKGSVLEATYATYEQWIRGDFQKRGKSITYLKSVLKALVETGGSQVTHSSLAQRVGEMSKPTFIDYCELLERLDVIFELQAFDQNRCVGFPKKARKFHFWDPFIMDTVLKWLVREGDIAPKDGWDPLKAESVAAAHFKKRYPTFYFKGDGEIDVVFCRGKEVTYGEVKWSGQVRPSDLKELQKRRGTVILTRSPVFYEVSGILAVPLPLYLIRESHDILLK